MGLRIRDAENVPKPLVQIGYRPVLWHVMKYYAHYGHKDFILCLGYGADAIKRYFLDYSECASNDFVLSQGGRKVELFNSDIHDWRITFATPASTPYRPAAESGRALPRWRGGIPGQLQRRSHRSPLPQQLDHFHRNKKIASFLCVLPNLSYHVVSTEPGSSLVTGVHAITNGSVRINGGYFAFKKEIFNYIEEGKSSSSNHSSASSMRSSCSATPTMASGPAWIPSRPPVAGKPVGSGSAPWHAWRGDNALMIQTVCSGAVAEFSTGAVRSATESPGRARPYATDRNQARQIPTTKTRTHHRQIRRMTGEIQ